MLFRSLLDIQDVIAKGKRPSYERWVKVHNIKQISQTLLFLRDVGIRDMDELTKELVIQLCNLQKCQRQSKMQKRD